MKIKCRKCGHRWNYRGRSNYFVTCPQCLRKVKVKGKMISPEVLK